MAYDGTEATAFEIRSEARGPHWIAWLTRNADPAPVKAVIIVGKTKEEAEGRARAWATEASRDGYL